jgi:hypothetical protein
VASLIMARQDKAPPDRIAIVTFLLARPSTSPYTRGRDIDLSRGAARAIGLVDIGLACAEIS